jgi:hypothetical protein
VLARMAMPGLTSSILGLFLAATTTLLAASFLVKPEIPSSSRFFSPACQALQYLSKQRPPGRMLNDSKLGSMLTFCLANPPDIFIDGRFDSYSRQVINDYQIMRLAKPGYLDLLASYKIDWVFFPPATPLVDSLIREPGWRVYYQDRDAVILARVVGRP